MGKGRKKPKVKAVEYAMPTEAQFEHGDYERALMAYKRVVAIKRLYAAGTLNLRQYLALDRYRDIAISEDRSFTKDSLDKAMQIGGGDGTGLPPSAIRTAIELGRLERALGSLRSIARAIAVDDMTLSQWAMQQAGAVQREKPGIGRKVIIWFEPRRKAKEIATLEIQYAGNMLANEIGY